MKEATRRLRRIGLMLWSLMLMQPAAWAGNSTDDNAVVFLETFDSTTGTGGNDNAFSDNIATNKINSDNEDWTFSSCGGASKCLKFGTGSADGQATTPAITLTDASRQAVLTFRAAGWASGTNKLSITANDGVELTGDTGITLTSSTWAEYTVNITLTTAETLTLTFTGRRGFIDDIKVAENITGVAAPTLTNAYTFWPKTTETPTETVTITPAPKTTVRYTTDGSEPTVTSGTAVTTATAIDIHGTTTVKAVAYVGNVTSSVVSRTYTLGQTVSSIADFRQLPAGTEARLYLSDEQNARVLHTNGNEFYLRDNTGALCVYFGSTATFNPQPRHNQHVAGWIIGRYQPYNGLPELVATTHTTTDYLALADPVTEAATEPHVISADDYDRHLADWVTVQNLRMGSSITAYNKFGTSYTDPYDGALVDLSGMAIPYNSTRQIAPVSMDGEHPVVYVLDESQDFTPPSEDIADATVRLVRTLSHDYWNTLTVPFAMPLEGQVRAYDHADGQTMVFADADRVEPGKPYLVKPVADIENPVFTGVTLSSTTAQTVSDGAYSFVGTYSPAQLSTDQTERFLGTDGKLYYPQSTTASQLRGLRAYFRVPQGAPAAIAIGGEATTGIGDMSVTREQSPRHIYTLSGQTVGTTDVSRLPQGIYIVNGKKLIIR